MANEVEIVVTSKDKTGPGFDSADKKAKTLGSTLMDVGKIAGGFLAANLVANAAASFTSYVNESISAASNLQQAMGGSTAIFGDFVDGIKEFAVEAAHQVGLSQEAFLRFSAPLGASLKLLGMSKGEAAKMTVELTKRAADMAATFGGPVSEALAAIQSALRGESDPIERYGVGITEARVATEALAMTGKKSAAALTDQEKAAARLNLIFKQTQSAAGQFAAEEDTLAGKQERANAVMENQRAAIGEKLLPAMMMWTDAKLKIATVIGEKVIPALTAITKWAKENPELIKAIAIVIGTVLVTAFLAWAVAATQAAIATVVATYPIILIIAAIALLVVAIVLLVKHWDTVREAVLTVWTAVYENTVRWTQRIAEYITNFFDAIGSFIGKLGPRIDAAADGMWDGIKKSFRNAINWIIDRWNHLEFRVPSVNFMGATIGGFTLGMPDIPRLAHGGVAGGLAMVGERGRELVRLPQGSTVMPNGTTEAMLAAGGRGGVLELLVRLDPTLVGPSRDLAAALVRLLRLEARPYGGSVDELVRAGVTA